MCIQDTCTQQLGLALRFHSSACMFIRVMNFVCAMRLVLSGWNQKNMIILLFQGKLSIGTMASFIGYTFTLTFAVSSKSCLLSILL